MKVAFVFPGQGSQSLGMLSELYDNYPQVKECYDLASQALGFDLWDIVQHDKEKLNQTEYTQPALLTASYAIFKIIKEVYPELKPQVLAGHSLGEYSALTCAGVLDFVEAVKLVKLRGYSMQSAVPEGGVMYAVLGLEDQVIIDVCNEVCAELNQVVAAANFNCNGQVVIAGTKEASAKVAQLLKEKGAKRCLPLSVSAPSHCPLMQPAADKMEQAFANVTFNPAIIDVMHNADLSISHSKDEFISALLRQLTGPVLWTQTIEKLKQEGFTHFVEVGPANVLTGIIRRIDKSLNATEVNNLTSLDKLKEFLQ